MADTASPNPTTNGIAGYRSPSPPVPGATTKSTRRLPHFEQSRLRQTSRSVPWQLLST
jgi:hypothetical protein